MSKSENQKPKKRTYEMDMCNGPILKRVKSIEILFHTDGSGNFVECSLYGKEYLKATVQYVLQ